MLEPFKVVQPDLHKGSHVVFDPRLTGKAKRELVAFSHLGRVDPLLQPVVAGEERLSDSC